MATPASSSEQTVTTKPRRVLACVLCQHRKIKCDRTFPCVNCVRACVECQQSTRQRHRRFPEKELLARLRHYERLLHRHKIKFDPLHTPTTDCRSPNENGRDEFPEDVRSEDTIPDKGPRLGRESTAVKSKPLNLWHAMSQKTVDFWEDDGDYGEDDQNDTGFLHKNDDVRQAVIKKAWNHMFQGQSNDHLLFGSPVGNVDLSTLHPTQVQIFRLWQIYLDNVNPLLKVSHTPTLQTRIIDAASDIANINPALEALMFGIYCVSILSLTEDECSALFGCPKRDLLTSYQFACQQALRGCCILRSNDRNCLTAFYLYLVSIRPYTDPSSLSSLLSIAIRIAQRMGIHNDSMYGKWSTLETEMRRRLWWSLVIFDNRICEMSDYKTASLSPTWDCRLPLNVNDFELRPEMQTPPTENNRPTEMVFAIVRSELADFVRHSAFHLDCTNPFLSTVARQDSSIDDAERLLALEKAIEEKYLGFCNPENPLHFMTIWTTRGYLAKNRLLQHYAQYSTAPVQQTDTQRSMGISYALHMLESDTKLMTSPLTKGYMWFIHIYFPFPAYIHILQSLKRWPIQEHVDQAWEVMSNNYEVRILDTKKDDRPFYILLSQIVLQAWEAREQVVGVSEDPLMPPRIVSDIRKKVMQMTLNFAQDVDTVQPGNTSGVNGDNLSIPMQMNFNTNRMAHGAGKQLSTSLDSWGYPQVPRSSSMEMDANQFLSNMMDWDNLQAPSS
ncbi:uncharacterized protein N7500_002886 [Penicillium coprophilum]|uniref:uncharacterized protein n=1 Tax=Penicillium coprophilum TaxID=36646 RepID=UPI0023986D7B|nr:uncharacterized protein N7500_002886 [Penicillium coprophilum]KAJ5170103.1 hypothetical protein N7500_002886 [Penicillium coprophilum]